MKKVTLVLALFMGLTRGFAQNENNKMALSEFNSIVVSSSMDIKLVQGTENSISIKDGNLMDAVTAEVKNDVLYLKKGKDDITVNFTKLNKIELQSDCDVKSLSQVSSDKLDVSIFGSGDLNLNLNVKELNTTIEGSGDAKYTGTADSHIIKITGSGNVNANGLVTTSTNVEIGGSGDAAVNATQDLKGVINGSGNITYFSEPVNKDVNVNGSGSYGVKRKGEERATGDTTKLKFKHSKVLIIKDNEQSSKKGDTIKNNVKKFNVYWAGFGFGWNNYHESNQFKLPLNLNKIPLGYEYLKLDNLKSINLTFNFLEEKIPIWKKHINIVTGMGFDISNYRFSDNKYYLDAKGTYPPDTSAFTLKENKLTTIYFNIPLLLQFDTKGFGKNKHTFHLSAGVVGGVRVESHTKQEYEISGTLYKPKSYDDFNLNNFRYSAMVRLGYGDMDIYASYTLNSIFKSGQEPLLYPITIGFTVIGF